MPLENLPPTLTVEQAGALLGISRRTAYRAAHEGQIPTLRVGRRILVPTSRLLSLLGTATLGDRGVGARPLPAADLADAAGAA